MDFYSSVIGRQIVTSSSAEYPLMERIKDQSRRSFRQNRVKTKRYFLKYSDLLGYLPRLFVFVFFFIFIRIVYAYTLF